MVNWYLDKHGFWLRIFGYGFAIKPLSQGLLFSERYGYTKIYRIGKYYFKFLNRRLGFL